MARMRTYKQFWSKLDKETFDFSGSRSMTSVASYRPRVQSWILRILLGAGDMPVHDSAGERRYYSLAGFLQVPQLADPEMTAREVFAALEAAYAKLHGAGGRVDAEVDDPESLTVPVPDCPMKYALQWLSESAGLNPVEAIILEFAVALRIFGPLRMALGHWETVSQGDMAPALAGILHLPVEDVEQACMPQGLLFDSGLLYNRSHSEDTLDAQLLMPGHLAQRIAFHRGPPDDILSHLAVPLKASGLTLSDFAHVQQHTELAQCWLEGALLAAQDKEALQGSAGHLLVTGGPGLGKTEWVRALLAQAKAQAVIQAVELVVLANQGIALSGVERLSHLRLTMRLLRGSPRGVIVFDEADDIFSSGNPLMASSDDAVSMVNHRASLNRLLEDSQIPVVWIMNRPEVLDPAVLRRFDTVIAFEGLPRSVRLAMLDTRLGQARSEDPAGRRHQPQGLEATELQRWAEVESLTPAMIDRLALVRERAHAAGYAVTPALSRHWLRQRLPAKATRHLRKSRLNHALLQIHWKADSVNASEDLLSLAQGIGRSGTGRILLYGPPGTGKTAYAKALANMLDKPLLERRASDLLSAFVGGTEQEISGAFEQALVDDAVLFIDEADSLVYSRDRAVRNWEVSQVNELLEQLSDFEGVVVLATNRLQALDAAVLRRMDAKVQFSPLTTEQVIRGLQEMLGLLGADTVLSPHHLQAVQTMTELTPGDFACVARRLVIQGVVSEPLSQLELELDPDDPHVGRDPSVIPEPWADRLIAMLQEELSFKTPSQQPIGFVRHGKSSGASGTED